MALMFTSIFVTILTIFQSVSAEQLYTPLQLSEPEIDSLLRQAAEGANFVCPEASGRFSSADDCTRFYTCENSKARLRQCINGLMFDSIRKRCVPQSQAVCGRKEVECSAPPQGRQEGFICPTAGIAGYPDTRNCSKYNLCIFSRRFDVGCSSGRMFDSPSRRCVTAETAKCETPDTFQCPSNGLFPHPYGCDRYYKCCNGQATVEYCGTGRLFNTQQCVWSFGILERCPTPPKTPSTPVAVSDQVNSTAGTNQTPQNVTLFEPLETDDDSKYVTTPEVSLDNKTIEEQKREVERLINELSGYHDDEMKDSE